jgi:hypothetical protein
VLLRALAHVIFRRLYARRTKNAQIKQIKKKGEKQKKPKGTPPNFVIFIKYFFAIFWNKNY